MQNDILRGCWHIESRTRSVELAQQLLAPHSPYSKSQVVRALQCARGSLYLQRKRPLKDKRVAVAISQWHEPGQSHYAQVWHSDQGKQYGAAQARKLLLEKGFVRSMSRAGTPTDNGYAERFVGLFKCACQDVR